MMTYGEDFRRVITKQMMCYSDPHTLRFRSL